ncbi:MAG TPA: SEC-C metal-binding domain-containing protein [Pirellulaceae bacterium]|nr:SEC-C metal-binding domain-containing protein [Pirellulaceae bacterium]
MEALERVWEYTGMAFNGVLNGFERSLTGLFGSSNARYVKKLEAKVEAISALESRYEAMSDEELRAQTARFRERLANGETLEDLLIEAFAVCREGGRRFLGMRHYDVQMIGGMVLHSGSIAEMVTGEGKTLVATLPAYLNALEGKGVHVVTVNDYLARRDMEWMGPLYLGLGLTVGAIQSDMSVSDRQKSYDCDITYGTNNEFGFDYLRDNMRIASRGDDRFPKQYQQSQGPLNFAIIDEVDNILIDEARTPLIISGPAFDDIKKYAEADRIARQLKEEVHFKIDEKQRNVTLNDEGVRIAEKLAGVESFYTPGNMEWPHLIDNSLKAHFLYKRDVNYVVKGDKIVIIDEFTGREMDGRQWSDGLHQSVEAKEGVRVKEETQTLATITLQNFFKLYGKICGMTGTAMTEANEFWKIYKLDVIAIPTNRAMQRIEHPDVIYRTEKEKYEALADEIERMNKFDTLELKDGKEVAGSLVKEEADSYLVQLEETKEKQLFPKTKVRSFEPKGRPILVGTVSIEKSEKLSRLLEQRGIKHEVLNAKHHKREAEIIAQAGRIGAVTVATNMAGRGTDIILGGNPETMAWAILQDKYKTRLDVPREEWDELASQIDQKHGMKVEGKRVREMGGLCVMGTERHESRRIDLQLRGRCGRQGDPGSSRFFLSLEDDLMRIFAGEWVRRILDGLGMGYKEAIESKMVTRRVEGAQKKVEERNFEIRKNLLEYDEVMDQQRKRVYGFRQRVLDGFDTREQVEQMLEKEIARHVELFQERDFGVETYAAWLSNELKLPFENPRQFRGMDGEQASQQALEEAERQAEALVLQKIDECLPEARGEDEDEADVQKDWNWQALAKYMNSFFGTNYRDIDLRGIERDALIDKLTEDASAHIRAIDLSQGNTFLEDDFGIKSLAGWFGHKFGRRLDIADLKKLDKEGLKKRLNDLSRESYDLREAQYPIMAAIYRFARGDGQGNRIVDKEQLAEWATRRFETTISPDDLKSMQREEVEKRLLLISGEHQKLGRSLKKTLLERWAQFEADPAKFDRAGFEDWLKQEYHLFLEPSDWKDPEHEKLLAKLVQAHADRFHPEMRRMERGLLLQILDGSWKDHLLTMDRLRSSVGFVGYAQLDAKVEYKREGMQLFDKMWQSVSDRVSELMFKMEQLNEDFVSTTWVETAARHDQARTAVVPEELKQSQQAIDATKDVKIEPIRNVGVQLRRNDPCHCGSGKKYKSCCLRKDTGEA